MMEIKTENYKFNQHRACEFFPCHSVSDDTNFNCLFCYCPLYALGKDCGGNFTYTEQGIKDCSGCLRPHRRDAFDSIMQKMGDVMDLAKKP